MQFACKFIFNSCVCLASASMPIQSRIEDHIPKDCLKFHVIKKQNFFPRKAVTSTAGTLSPFICNYGKVPRAKSAFNKYYVLLNNNNDNNGVYIICTGTHIYNLYINFTWDTTKLATVPC